MVKIKSLGWIAFVITVALLSIAIPAIPIQVVLFPIITLAISLVLIKRGDKGRNSVVRTLKLTHRIAYAISVLTFLLVLFGVQIPVLYLFGYPMAIAFYTGIARANASARKEVSNRELIRNLAMLTPFAQALHLVIALAI